MFLVHKNEQYFYDLKENFKQLLIFENLYQYAKADTVSLIFSGKNSVVLLAKSIFV